MNHRSQMTGRDRVGSQSQGILQDTILALLRSVKGILGARTLAHILGAEIADVREALAALDDRGLAKRKLEYNAWGWRESSSGTEVISPDSDVWWLKFKDYVLLNPGASLPEVMIVLRWNQLASRDRTTLLILAMKLAKEKGELKLLSHIIPELMTQSSEVLSDSDKRDILENFFPRMLRIPENEAAGRFIEGFLKSHHQPSHRILALVKLGELELANNRIPSAEQHLTEALDLSMEERSGRLIPVIIEELVEIQRDFQGMKHIAERIHQVIYWLEELDDNDLKVEILATAASSFAHLRRNGEAESAIQSALTLAPVVSLATRQVLEWCRARVCIASGKYGKAIGLLERSLLMAENLNNQMAVSGILGTIVVIMKEHPGYTVRSLVSIMERVSGSTMQSGNISNQLFALNHLVDMYSRTLQLRKARKSIEEVRSIVESSDEHADEPVTEWYSIILQFYSGGEIPGDETDLPIPGTAGFLLGIRNGIDPSREAGAIAEYLNSITVTDKMMYALILALEAFASGYRRSSAVIAAALSSASGNNSVESVISWELCISGLLAAEPRHADDFFSSAEVLARQMDRLLLVWLILRCRMQLDLDRDFVAEVEIRLLLAEMDLVFMRALPEEERADFLAFSGAGTRSTELGDFSGVKGSLMEIRDVMAEKVRIDPGTVMNEIEMISARKTPRSEISYSLAILGLLAHADRVAVLKVKDGEIRIIESYGLGKSRLPGDEAAELILSSPEEIVRVNNFGRNPFGSRRYIIVPIERAVTPMHVDRKLQTTGKTSCNYLLLEIESPLRVLDESMDFLLSAFYRQIGSALMLRDRESLAYVDSLTGSLIGYSWTKRLKELLDSDISRDASISVMLIDIDNFRGINDLFDFSEGDRILKFVVTVISETLRPNDMTGRIRDDVFGILLPGANAENALTVAQRIRSRVASTDLRPDQVPVTISIGYTTTDSREERSDLVISRAWSALRKCKEEGGNSIARWTEDIDSQAVCSRRLAVFNTGDPGWDCTLNTAVLEILTIPVPSPELLASKFRDGLRCQYVYIRSGSGEEFEIGSRLSRKIRSEITSGKKGRVTEYPMVLGRYHVLATELLRGGRFIAGWDDKKKLPCNLRNLFEALASLCDLQINRSLQS